MPIKEKQSNLIIDVEGTTKTDRHTFAQDSFGNLILESKKTFDNVDFDLKIDQNTKIKIPLKIESEKSLTKTLLNNFDLKASNSNLLASINISDNVDDSGTTATEDYWTLLKEKVTGNILINLKATFSDSTPSGFYPSTRNIYADAHHKEDPILKMSILAS